MFLDGFVESAQHKQFFSFEDESGENPYLKEVVELQNPERNTLNVQFDHITKYNAVLASAIELQFYR